MGELSVMHIDQEQGLRILDNALWRIARQNDCDYDLDEERRPKPCDCSSCVARAALQAAKNWRFCGAFWERTQNGHWPREAKMHAAWRKLASSQDSPDGLLSRILKEDGSPSARDWYVATTVVQWLATSVGMTVLEAAGFTYQQWEQDRADGELFRRRQEQDQNEAERLRRRQERKKPGGEAVKAPTGQESPSPEEPSSPAQVPGVGTLPKLAAETPTDPEAAMPGTLAEWADLVAQLNALRKRLDQKPEKWRMAYSLHPVSLLNAYREGDLSFDEACTILGSKEFLESCGARHG